MLQKRQREKRREAREYRGHTSVQNGTSLDPLELRPRKMDVILNTNIYRKYPHHRNRIAVAVARGMSY